MMCVYETLPPRALRRWLLITTRWSMSSLTGRDRTLVAVGTVNETSMFLAVRAKVPRMVVLTGSSTATLGRFWTLGGSAGTPPRAPGAVGRVSLLGEGFSTVGGRRGGGGGRRGGGGGGGRRGSRRGSGSGWGRQVGADRRPLLSTSGL